MRKILKVLFKKLLPPVLIEIKRMVKYFDQFNRISDTLYFKSLVKQWADTSSKALDIETYTIRDNWSKILHERSVMSNDYFNAIYKNVI